MYRTIEPQAASSGEQTVMGRSMASPGAARWPARGLALVKAYVVTMRPYLMFVSGVTGLLGLSLAPETSGYKLVPPALACWLAYGFGQALTDCFQTDTDSLSAPYRPLVQGAVGRNLVLGISVAGLVACTVILAWSAPINVLLGALGGVGLAVYTPFKRRWWGGPPWNAWIVVDLLAMAFLAGGGWLQDFRRSPMLLAASVVLFGYANFVLAGYFKDVEADRATAYDTLPVRFGRRVSAWASDGLALLTAGAAIALAASEPRVPSSPWALVCLVGAILELVLSQVRLHRVSGDGDAHRAIVPNVHSYVLLLTGLVLQRRPDWLLPLAVCNLGFLVALRARPERGQV